MRRDARGRRWDGDRREVACGVWLAGLLILAGGAQALAAAPGPGAAVPEGQGGATIFMGTERPLLSLAQQLRDRYGMMVTYEDAVAPLPDCGVGGAAFDAAAASALWLAVSFEVAPATDQPADPAAVLRSALAVYRTACPAATVRYGLRQEGAVFHIVPEEVRDPDGTWHKVVPILDARIEVERAVRPIVDSVYLILGRTARATGITMQWGDAAMNWTFMRTVDLGGAAPQPARDLLSAAVAPATWELCYGAPFNMYFLHVEGVRQPAPKPAP